ncbi:MAG: ABC transporter permease [Mesorhizobium sp.]|nr:MAG: ABC transporter permease [Mesorhizobium sp.]TIM78028.1 MAG: ABC transporter permease [Mesorhizobium sp.]
MHAAIEQHQGINSPGVSTRLGQMVRDWWLVVLPFAFYAAFFIVPVLLIALQSFATYNGESHGADAVAGALTFDNYLNVFTPTFRLVFAASVQNALLGTALCIAVGYPVAYFISTRCPDRLKPWLLVLVVVPFWTSYLLRMLGWRILLGGNGIVSQALQAVGLLRTGESLLFTQTAVQLGLVSNFLPMMILPIYVSIDRLSKDQREASRDLYARPWQTFLGITLPQTAPGITAGAMIVFITMTSDYVTPELMGGAKGMMIGTLIYSQFLQGENWPLASAMALSLVVVVVASVLVMAGAASAIQRLPAWARRLTR